MLKETTLVRLSAPLSKAIDEAVDNFLQEHRKAKAHKRWQGADLWMVFEDRADIAEEGVIVTYRVTVAAYSDDPGRLVFIPDIIKTTLAGRYVLEETYRASLVQEVTQRLAEKSNILYVHEVVWRLASPHEAWSSRIAGVKKSVGIALQVSWRVAESLEANKATILLP